MLLILRSKKRASKKIARFNKKIAAHLKRLGVSFEFSSFEDAELFLDNHKAEILINGKKLETWKTVYPRKVGPYRGMSFIIANLCKEAEIKFIDRFHEKSKDSSDTAKIVQMFKFALKNIPIPKTYYAVNYSSQQLKNASRFLGFPMVIKQCGTSQGAGVFLAKNISALKRILSELGTKKDFLNDIFLQEFLPNDYEYRVFVIEKTVGAIEKKIRTKDEFRNNVHLGAKELFINANQVKKDILKAAIKAATVANIQVCGVDIVESTNGKIAVFEANSCPGITLNEKISPELKLLSQYLSLCEKR